MGTAAPLARRRLLAWALGVGAAMVAVLVGLFGAVAALIGGELGCLRSGSDAGQPPASLSALREIPPDRLRLYREAGRRFVIDWAFLASIGAQECGHGACRGVNSSGCAGPMQIGVGGACGNIWDRYKVDGDGDGRIDVNDPADAIFTAARILRQAKGAPPTGGSHAAYRRAACNYYGACGDASVPYAEQVMARAVAYGFWGVGAPAPTYPGQGPPVPVSVSAGGCSAAGAPSRLGGARRAFAPRRLEPLPADVTTGGRELCDARITGDVTFLARRFGVLVTDCYASSGHAADGEHPLGAAADLVPRGGDWSRTLRLARALGWERSCALSGLRPECADPPFRFIGYNGFPNHGDPLNCVPCAGGPHLHLSWQTSASPGQPDNRPRYRYEPAEWIDVLARPEGWEEIPLALRKQARPRRRLATTINRPNHVAVAASKVEAGRRPSSFRPASSIGGRKELGRPSSASSSRSRRGSRDQGRLRPAVRPGVRPAVRAAVRPCAPPVRASRRSCAGLWPVASADFPSPTESIS
jgi:hypothetical protein